MPENRIRVFEETVSVTTTATRRVVEVSNTKPVQLPPTRLGPFKKQLKSLVDQLKKVDWKWWIALIATVAFGIWSL